MLPPHFVPRFREPAWRDATPRAWTVDARMPRSRTVWKSNFLTRMTPWTRGRIFHTGHALCQRVRPQAPLRRNARLAGREFVRASGGRPGQAMPPNGVAEDPLTNGGPREPRRSPPGPRVAAASRGRLRARAAGEPARVPPGGDARSRCFGLGGKCCLSTCARSLDTCFGE